MSDYFDRLFGRAGRTPGPALVRPDRPLWTGPSATAEQATDPLADAESADEDPSREHPPGERPAGERPAGTGVRHSSTDPARAPGSGPGDRNPARSRRDRAVTESAESAAADSSDPTFTGPEPPAGRFAVSPDDAGAAPTPPFDGSASGTARRSGSPDRFDPKLATEQALSDGPAHLAAPAAPSTGNDGVGGTADGEFRADGDPDPSVGTAPSELARIDALLFGAAGVEVPSHLVDEPANSIVAPSVAASMPDPPGGDRVHIDHLSIEIVGPPAAAPQPPQRRAAPVPRATAQLGSGPVAWRRS